jgi:glycosyltransferase involved in cell wall biosynthesis
MRIAQVAPLYESVPPKLYGGTERVVSWLTEELVRLGHDVTLFASGDSLTKAELVPICAESLRSNPNCGDPLAHHMVMLERVRQKREQFDLIHFHIDYLHFPVSRCSKLPNLTTLHGRLDIEDLKPVYEEFREMPVVSISDAQRGPLPGAHWQATVHHGMPPRLYEPRFEAGKYLAFLGRTSPEKGVDEAIAIARLTGMPLKIAAKVDAVDRDYFANVIKPLLNDPLIEFVGEIGYGEKKEFLANAMALLFPVQWPEPFGIAMIEAMACGTPVIAYPRGSVPEVMRDGISGYVVRNPQEAAEAIVGIEQLDRRLVRNYFEDNFTSSRMAADYLGIYRRLACGNPEPVSASDGVRVD